MVHLILERITKVNTENVYNMLLNMISATRFTFNDKLIGVLSIVFNRIQVMLVEDPALCLKHLKLFVKWYVEMVRGQNPGNPGISPWFWNEDKKCPIMLDVVIDLWNSFGVEELVDINHFHRFVIALLSIHRVFVIPTEADYSTIIEKGESLDFKAPEALTDINSCLQRLGISPAAFRAEYKRRCEAFKYTVLSSAGPNGEATWTAHSDEMAFAANPDMLKILKVFCEISEFGVPVVKDLLACVATPSDIKDRSELRLGRIHSIEEWGGKLRHVAIVDYWTQMVLTPLHDTINHFLKRITADGTFNQEKIARDVRAWTADPARKVYSYDLTAATDRLPVELQVKVIEALLGSHSLACAWKNLLVGRPYYVNDTESVKYGRGQPMGARSSFPMLALTHHIIVEWAAHLAKVRSFKDYRILGDDNVIANSAVAIEYTKVMSWLGVPINESKSVIHSESALPAAEICKRIFISGQEFTSIPVKLLAKTARDGKLAPILQDQLSVRDYKMDAATNAAFMYSILDSDSFREIMIMNVLPQEICGLRFPLPLDSFHLAKYDNWFDGIPLSAKDLVGIFTYSSAVDSLKRVDALLRTTVAISNAIAARYSFFTKSPLTVDHLWAVLGIQTQLPKSDFEPLIKDIKDFTPSHPIIQASEAEVQRITELLSGLISHNTEMHNRARRGLLDLMRNALTDIWLDTEAATAQGTRTILNSSLANLRKAVSKMGEDRKLVDIRLEYTVVISIVSGLWRVNWAHGSDVTINMIKSRIPTNVAIAQAGLQSALGQITISDK